MNPSLSFVVVGCGSRGRTYMRIEVEELARIANENGCKLIPCFVLRYTSFYRALKAAVDDLTYTPAAVYSDAQIEDGFF